jgi:cation/acetate symporter
MKGITYTQVAQYCILIFAFLVPAIFISIMMTNNFLPQLGFGSKLSGGEGVYLLDKLDGLNQELGFAAYTSGVKSKLDVFCITAALMVGTAGLPHVIVRFFTVRKVRDARMSAGWALVFIAILYTTAPAIAAFARTNLINTINNKEYVNVPSWFKNWEKTGLIAWADKNGDGIIQYRSGTAFKGKPKFESSPGPHGQRLISNDLTDSGNELFIDCDIIVLANPEIAQLPNWVVGLVAAGGLAAALSTAAGLLLVISTSISHDLMKKILIPTITEKQELLFARIAAGVAVVLAGYFGVHPPGFVAEVVAFAFGLAASSFFPAILLGIFSKRMNKQGAISGMLAGITFTASYIIYYKFINPAANVPDKWLFGISPEGIGALGMAINFVVAFFVSAFTAPPPERVQALVEEIRIPKGANMAHEISA